MKMAAVYAVRQRKSYILTHYFYLLFSFTRYESGDFCNKLFFVGSVKFCVMTEVNLFQFPLKAI